MSDTTPASKIFLWHCLSQLLRAKQAGCNVIPTSCGFSFLEILMWRGGEPGRGCHGADRSTTSHTLSPALANHGNPRAGKLRQQQSLQLPWGREPRRSRSVQCPKSDP